MAMQMKIKVGLNEIQVSGEDEKELIEAASFFGQLPCSCGNCQSQEIGFSHRTALKDGKPCHFYGMRCNSCKWEFKFGVRQDGSGLFPKPSDDSSKGGWQAPYNSGYSAGRDENEDQSRQQYRRDTPQQTRSGRPPVGRKEEPLPEDEDNVPF